MHVVVRSDGGPDLGYGHLVRSGAVGEYLESIGHEVTYLSATPQCAIDVLPGEPASVGYAGDNTEEFLERLVGLDADIVITDLPQDDVEYLLGVRDAVSVSLLISDSADLPVAADIVVNGNSYAHELRYDWIGPEPTWCLGTSYLPLTEEVRSYATECAPWRDPPRQALVTMGGSDVRGETPAVLDQLRHTVLGVDVVVGPGFSNRSAIERAADKCGDGCVLHDNPDDLAALMFEADLAISATGTTAYELLATMTPTIGIPQADNQVAVASSLSARDALIWCESTGVELQDAVRSLIENQSLRRRLRDNGVELVDGEGVRRIEETIQEHR